MCRRRKKDEDTSHGSHSNRVADAGRNSNGGHKFDLEADAFPPLPAHIAESSTSTTSAPVNSTATSNQSDNHLNDGSSQLNWENGLVLNVGWLVGDISISECVYRRLPSV